MSVVVAVFGWLVAHPHLLLLAALTVPLWRRRIWRPGWGPVFTGLWLCAWWLT